MNATTERRALTPGGPTRTRAERARSEPMAVSPVGEGYYDVVTDDDSVYTVSLPEGRCTCPDSRIRGATCKHVRRVEMDVAAARVPPPDRREATCAECSSRFFADEDEPDPVYCASCRLRPGEPVIDREGGDLVFVVRSTDRRADEVPVPGTDHAVADHPTNEGYDRNEPVVEAVYPLPADLDPDDLSARRLRSYSFPRRRLTRPPS